MSHWKDKGYVYSNGSEDGLDFCLALKDNKWAVYVRNADGKELSKSWDMTYEPRFGIDVYDANMAEKYTDQLINQMKDKGNL